jgi:seryl-tRNA synthetase
MLDITLLRKDLDAVVAALAKRKNPQPFLNVEAFKALETERKTIQTRTEELQAQRNSAEQADRAAQGQGRIGRRRDGPGGRHQG